jgi:hypothetical protein
MSRYRPIGLHPVTGFTYFAGGWRFNCYRQDICGKLSGFARRISGQRAYSAAQIAGYTSAENPIFVGFLSVSCLWTIEFGAIRLG